MFAQLIITNTFPCPTKFHCIDLCLFSENICLNFICSDMLYSKMNYFICSSIRHVSAKYSKVSIAMLFSINIRLPTMFSQYAISDTYDTYITWHTCFPHFPPARNIASNSSCFLLASFMTQHSSTTKIICQNMLKAIMLCYDIQVHYVSVISACLVIMLCL